jgi:hypothetical protein
MEVTTTSLTEDANKLGRFEGEVRRFTTLTRSDVKAPILRPHGASIYQVTLEIEAQEDCLLLKKLHQGDSTDIPVGTPVAVSEMLWTP